MELFLLFIPAIIIPVGLSIAGIWWLLGSSEESGEDIDDLDDSNDIDGGF